jgi:hypothetical protein
MAMKACHALLPCWLRRLKTHPCAPPQSLALALVAVDQDPNDAAADQRIVQVPQPQPPQAHAGDTPADPSDSACCSPFLLVCCRCSYVPQLVTIGAVRMTLASSFQPMILVRPGMPLSRCDACKPGLKPLATRVVGLALGMPQAAS